MKREDWCNGFQICIFRVLCMMQRVRIALVEQMKALLKLGMRLVRGYVAS